MVKEPTKSSKRGLASGEPAPKKYCKQLHEPSKYPVPFTGTNTNQEKGTKRLPPQDNLSAQVYKYVLGV